MNWNDIKNNIIANLIIEGYATEIVSKLEPYLEFSYNQGRKDGRENLRTSRLNNDGKAHICYLIDVHNTEYKDILHMRPRCHLPVDKTIKNIEK